MTDCPESIFCVLSVRFFFSLQVLALEELEIRDLDQVTRVYAALLCAHVKLLKVLVPRVMWKEVPVVMIFEQNTYVNALVDVKNLIEHSLARSGSKICFYSKWSHINNKYMLGKYVSAKAKLEMVLSTVSAIGRRTLCYCDTVMSLGWAVLAEVTKKTHLLELTIGSTKGAGSSNRMGSTMDVSMYRRSSKGVNLPTDIATTLLESRDVITLPEERITDKMHAEQGKMLLGKLRDEMSMVTITESTKGTSTVTTGGKRSVEGEYTRDDMLSAFLLLCHTRDEIHSGEGSVKIRGEVYYK